VSFRQKELTERCPTAACLSSLSAAYRISTTCSDSNVSGWWKEQPNRDRSEMGARYALVVSIQTAVECVDIWTPVAQQIGIPVQAIQVEW